MKSKLPEGWEEVRLADVIQFNPRESIKKGTIAKKIGMNKLMPFQKIIEGFELAEYKSGTKFRNGDTLLARITPCLENGKTAQVTVLDQDEIGFGSTEYIVLREKNDLSINDFIYYLSLSPMIKDVAIKSMTGTSGRQRAQRDVIEDNIIKFPSVEEQKVIADTLSSLDNKIEANNKINKNLEQQAQEIFKHWFVDFEFPDESGKPYKSSGGEMVESELDMIPEEWEVKSIIELPLIVTDYVANGSFASLKANVTVYEESNYAYFIRNTDLKSRDFQRYVDKNSYEFLEKTKIFGGEIIVSNVGSVGNVYVAPALDKPMTLGNNILLLKPSSDLDINKFIYYLLSSHKGEYLLSSITSGSVQKKFNKTDFRNLNIVFPNKKTLEKFNNVVNPIFESMFALEEQNQALTQLRDTLLPKLMSGEIRIPLD